MPALTHYGNAPEVTFFGRVALINKRVPLLSPSGVFLSYLHVLVHPRHLLLIPYPSGNLSLSLNITTNQPYKHEGCRGSRLPRIERRVRHCRAVRSSAEARREEEERRKTSELLGWSLRGRRREGRTERRLRCISRCASCLITSTRIHEELIMTLL